MKIKIFVALIATATIIFLSCNWFRSKKKGVSNPLVGEWKLDSIKAGKDTSIANSFIAVALTDSSGIDISFTKDSIFTHLKDAVDTVAYSFDEKENVMSIKDSSHQSFTFSKLNDSLIALTAKDSAVFFLQKK
jgi:hypothetical protein